MTDFMEIYSSSRKIIMWGAGKCANDFRNLYLETQRKPLTVNYYIDKNSSICDNATIYQVEKLKDEKDNVDLVLIATQYTESVLHELNEIGYKGNIVSVFNIIYKQKWGDTHKIEKNLENLKNILADEKSRNLVEIICNKRKNLDVDYSDYYEGRQYFVENIIKKEDDAIFVDAGAYDGGTIDEFIEFQQNSFERIISFEMNEVNYERIKKKKYDERVEIYNMGLWDTETECRYNLEEDSSKLGEGDYIAKCINLDKFLNGKRVSFIKMDIEGAETKALLGAKETIQKWKPQLAICIYHRQNDLWQIPLWVHSIVPEYKLYVRHHMTDINETVLYAIYEENK